MFSTEIRRTNDKRLYEWSKKILSKLKEENKQFTAHFIGYGQFDFDGDLNLITNLFANGNNIIIFCFDFIIQDTMQQIVEQVDSNNSIQLTWVGAQQNPFNHPRIKNIFWPGDMLLQNNEYKALDNIEKNPSDNRHWICTSLGIRPHRIYMASLLKGLGFDKYGDLRLKTVSKMGPKATEVSKTLAKGNGLAPDGEPLLSTYVGDKWKLQSDIGKISTEAHKGYQELITRNWWGSSIFLYSQYVKLGNHYDGSNDAGNFDMYLRHLYKDKTLEIVNETSHSYDPIFITEKFINAVFGMNFVIMNGPAGTVKLLEELGWNSCRHIINHDYDDIVNPITRCEQAVRLNSSLFTDPAHCNQLWRENLQILEVNRVWAKERLHEKVLQNCEQQFKKVA